MTVMTEQHQPVAQGGGRSGDLYDILELILDKGLVIDAFVRVSLVGIELLTIDVRVVVASVDTYLRFAEATNRLDLNASKSSHTLPELFGDVSEKGASGKTRGVLRGAASALSDAVHDGLGGEKEPEEHREPRRTRPRTRRPRTSGEDDE